MPERELRIETGAGVLTDPRNPAAIAEALRSLYADVEGRSQLAAAARQAAHNYCWEAEAPRLLALYDSL